jgi:aspartyl-tRNA(Asn)/glutamyl-tRNA(Gln) amidotransferase subunit A
VRGDAGNSAFVQACEAESIGMRTLRQIAADLVAGRVTSRQLIEECLARIADPGGEGAGSFVLVYDKAARATADWVDAMRRAGASLPEWAGIPVSIKDLFDVAGSVTTFASGVMTDAPPATKDAAAVKRLCGAGFIPIGRTNMTEFAYGAIGLNARNGTPAAAWDRASRRIPGGSTSGGAISVSDGMAYIALGSDSGGSCRIPAAINSIVGYKPTRGRIPIEGANSMAPSLDSIGPLAASVECASIADAILAGEPVAPIRPRPIKGLRLGIPRPTALEGLDAPIETAFDQAIKMISDGGASVGEVDLPELGDLPAINAKGGFSAPEYFAWHREYIAKRADQYDPRILKLIMRGRDFPAPDYLDLFHTREAMMDSVAAKTVAFDAIVMPTIPIVAPRIDAISDDAEYMRVNALLLRNTRVANFLDACAISVPCHARGEMPVGLMLQGARAADKGLFAIAAAIEALVSPKLG